MNKPIDLHTVFQKLDDALCWLEEACQQDMSSNTLAVDGTIKRFEFSFELFWKSLKKLLYTESIEVYSPRETLKKAYEFNWLQEETIWLDMLRARNESVHIYDKVKALQIYQEICGYCQAMRTTYNFLAQKYLTQEN